MTTLNTQHRQRLALATLSIAQLMLLVDATIVNVSLPSIQRSLGFSGSGLEWVVTAYSLTFGGLLLLGGRSGDILGRRRMFHFGLIVFTGASLAGGFATEQWWLIGCRALQGIGAAAAGPAGLSLIASTFPEGPMRNRAIGAYSATATAGGAIGLLAGGLISTYLSWRWVMFVNVPIGLVAIIVGPRVLAETAPVRNRFDLSGALTGTLGLTLLVYGLITGAPDHSGRSHWADPPVLASLGGAAVLLVAFVLIEKHTRHPLVPLRIFANRARSGILAATVLTTTATVGIFFFLTIFVQQVWRYSPLHTALVYVPLTGMLVIGIRAGSRLINRTGALPLIAGGLAAASVGMIWLSGIGDSGGYLTGMLAPTVLTYLGIGLTAVPLTTSAIAGVAPGETGLASGLLGAARQVGGATGLAVLGTVTWTAVAAGVAAGGDAQRALADGVSRGLVVAAGLTVLSLLVVLVTVPGRAKVS